PASRPGHPRPAPRRPAVPAGDRLPLLRPAAGPLVEALPDPAVLLLRSGPRPGNGPPGGTRRPAAAARPHDRGLLGGGRRRAHGIAGAAGRLPGPAALGHGHRFGVG